MPDLPDFMLAGVRAVQRAAPTYGAYLDGLQKLGEVLRDSAVAQDPPRERPPFVPGVFDDMPGETYFATEAMSQSGAKKMLQSPQHYRLERDTAGEPTQGMQQGTAVHLAVLEPDEFTRRVLELPEVNKRTNAGKDELASFKAAHPGALFLSAADYANALACRDAIHAHRGAAYLIHGGQFESSMFWNDAQFGVPCKARMDVLNHGGIIDLKKTQNASPEDFAKSMANYAYHVQAAHYISGHEHLLNESPRFFAIVAVEWEPPHAVACYVIGQASVMAGRHLMDKALARYRDALQSGTWPGYSDQITTLDVPAWARRFHD